MDIDELSEGLSSEDPAIGLRASMALHRLAERVEASKVASPAKRVGRGSRSETPWASPASPCTPSTTRSRRDHRIRPPEMLHAWAIYLRASEEARRRGDRRTGTDHLLLALLEDPSVEDVLGVNLERARQALESLDRDALGALGLESDVDVPLCRCEPCR